MCKMIPEIGGVMMLVGGLPFRCSVWREEGLHLLGEFLAKDLECEDLGFGRVLGREGESIQRWW